MRPGLLLDEPVWPGTTQAVNDAEAIPVSLNRRLQR